MLHHVCNLSPIDTGLVITENDSTNHGLKFLKLIVRSSQFIILWQFQSFLAILQGFSFQNLTQINTPCLKNATLLGYLLGTIRYFFFSLTMLTILKILQKILSKNAIIRTCFFFLVVCLFSERHRNKYKTLFIAKCFHRVYMHILYQQQTCFSSDIVVS